MNNKLDTIELMLFTLGIIIILFVTVSVISFSTNNALCNNKGFERTDINHIFSYDCAIETGYDKSIGEQTYCYMPSDKDMNAAEWCTMEN